MTRRLIDFDEIVENEMQMIRSHRIIVSRERGVRRSRCIFSLLVLLHRRRRRRRTFRFVVNLLHRYTDWDSFCFVFE